MQNKDVTRSIKHAIILALAALSVSGCLSEEGAAGFTDVEAADPGGDISASQNSAPRISGNPASAVTVGNMYSFRPVATDADADSLSFSIRNQPSWADFDQRTGKLSGRPTLGDIGVYNNIVVTVTDAKVDTSLAPFAVNVTQASTGSATLNLTAPYQNDDGSALTDLAGYKLYWGTTPGEYTNSLTIDSPGISTYVVDNLAQGTYEFVATAFNMAGIESRYSNTVTRVVR